MEHGEHPDDRHISRRQAMGAALAGVAAAAAWQAPRIEGLSVAPDVAQAATCLPVTGTLDRATTRTDDGQCWGTNEPTNLNCIASDPIPFAFDNISGTATYSGSWNVTINTGGIVTNNGQVAISLNKPLPLVSCTATLSGTCTSTGSTNTGPGTNPLTVNAADFTFTNPTDNHTYGLDCTDQFEPAGEGSIANVTINISCACP